MAKTGKLVSSMGKAELDRILVRGYDLNRDLLGKITFAQMVYLMLAGRMPTTQEGRMIDAMLIVLVDHGMTTGALAARLTYHSAPEAIQGAVAAAILGAGSVHLGSSEYCARMLHETLPPGSSDDDLDALAVRAVDKRLSARQVVPGIGHGIHTEGDPRAERLFQIARETEVYGRYCDLLRKIGSVAEEKVGRRLPVNVTGAIAAISLDMGLPWQMSKTFAILGRALGGIAHVGEEIRRPIAREISNLIRAN
ncbi:MAG TPA: citryl-CoA lyase, partial [Candidatus Eisenbacteria bacterium]|nr:citryl-CoA lyase [Candidatus Eisenbacteria bacterium]